MDAGEQRSTIRRRLTSIYIEHRVKEMTAARADAARASGRQPGPEGAIAKVFNAEHTQRRAKLSLDAAGMHGVAWLPGDTGADSRAQVFLRTRAATIEGGTSEVLRNQIGERILGMPRDVDVFSGIPWRQIDRSV